MATDEEEFSATGFVRSAAVDTTNIDTEVLKRRYREERAKRVGDTRAATTELTGELARYVEDPYTDRIERDPVSDEVEVVIVGAGFGSLLTAANLRKVGFSRIRIIDKAGDVGGVWYWNRYPGAMCDVESLTYLPLLEETGYVPKDKYAKASEILGYAQTIAKQYSLYDDALFQTTVTGASWDESAERWVTVTNRGDELRSQFVVVSDGNFHRLKIPAIPGIEKFAGTSFHTSRWDYEYTGGDPESELTGLSDKRVGIIGSAATAAQVVPPVARGAQQLFVFQRTPSTVGVRANGPIDEQMVAELEPGWQRKRVENFTSIVSGAYQEEDLVNDGWTDFYTGIFADPVFVNAAPAERAALIEKTNFAQMEAIRARVDSVIDDPATAEILKPYYAYFCTRPVFHDEYLQSFNRENTTLVDATAGIEKITERGVVVDGVEYELDCLIYATGFEYDTPYIQKTGFDIIGRDGLKISEKYAAGIATFQGLYSRGFPNLFMVPGSNMQSTVTFNVVHSLGENARHIAYVADQVRKLGGRYFDVDEATERNWVDTCVEHARDGAAFLESCTPNRFNGEGRLDRRKLQSSNYPCSPMQYFALLAEWRDEGRLEGLEIV